MLEHSDPFFFVEKGSNWFVVEAATVEMEVVVEVVWIPKWRRW